MFTEVELKDFRGFAHLKLDGLKRVNLIVGRNNAGKTSLLEAVTILADPNRLQTLPGLFRANAGRPESRYYRWIIRDEPSGRTGTAGVIKGRSTEKTEFSVLLLQRANDPHPTSSQHIFHSDTLSAFAPQNQPRISCRTVSVQHRSPDSLVKLFTSAVKRKGGEERIEKLLRQLDGRIQKVRVEPADDGIHLMIDLGLSEMVPIAQVGQGVYRLIAIFSELIGETPHICTVDELENGIHHSHLEQIWEGLASVAEELNTQLFVTTHSQECIEAAHAAFSARGNYDFSVVQLFRVESGVQGRVLDREHIEAALAGEIDLR